MHTGTSTILPPGGVLFLPYKDLLLYGGTRPQGPPFQLTQLSGLLFGPPFQLP